MKISTGVSWLDFKLGFRMLVKYPGLTLVGGVAIAFGIGVGAVVFTAIMQLLHPTLPLHEGERVVGIWYRDVADVEPDRGSPHDFATWREELQTVRDLGAFRTVRRNLATGDGPAEPTVLAEISASAFRLARVPPLLGRVLDEADEQPGAEPVLVLGYDLWQARFGGDPAVVGQRVRLGSTDHMVAGVMPKGFGFPISHQLWAPLRLNVLDYKPREGPELTVFGRLAPGATMEEAQAELAALGQRMAADLPESHQHLRPEVQPYAKSIYPVHISGTMRLGAYSANLIGIAFLALLCANVSLLVFARTAAREGEIVVRSALGASRSRIVAQLFAEALVLGGVACLAGLAAATLALQWAVGVFEAVGNTRPFWWDLGLSPTTVLYAALLTVLGALVVGAVPALKVTGPEVQAQLKRATTGGSSLRFGGVWTGVIIVQVALTTFFLPLLIQAALDTDEVRSGAGGFRAEEFLSLQLGMDQEALPNASPQAFDAQFGASYAALEQRLEAEPQVVGVTWGSQLPGGYHHRHWLELDDGMVAPPDGQPGHQIQIASIAPDFFEVLGAPILAGRAFASGDLEPEARTAIVNESFVREILGGRNPIGRRVRSLNADDPLELGGADAEPGPWYEIVGVASEVGLTVDPDLDHNAGVFYPASPGSVHPAQVAVHVRGEPEAFAPRLREIAFAVDPRLQIDHVLPLDGIRPEWLMTMQFWVRVALAVGGLLLLLSVAGIHAIMSFAVSRRTREIGIRAALGAGSGRIVREIFARSFVQIGLGIAAGLGLLMLLGGVPNSLRYAGLLTAGVAIMVAAGMLASWLPTRRALRIEPTEALRADT